MSFYGFDDSKDKIGIYSANEIDGMIGELVKTFTATSGSVSITDTSIKEVEIGISGSIPSGYEPVGFAVTTATTLTGGHVIGGAIDMSGGTASKSVRLSVKGTGSAGFGTVSVKVYCIKSSILS